MEWERFFVRHDYIWQTIALIYGEAVWKLLEKLEVHGKQRRPWHIWWLIISSWMDDKPTDDTIWVSTETKARHLIWLWVCASSLGKSTPSLQFGHTWHLNWCTSEWNHSCLDEWFQWPCQDNNGDQKGRSLGWYHSSSAWHQVSRGAAINRYWKNYPSSTGRSWLHWTALNISVFRWSTAKPWWVW